MKVPFFDLTFMHSEIATELLSALERVLLSNQFILGPEVEALERELALYSGAKHAVGLSSGTDALLVALMAAGVGSGQEVITTPFTFFATAGCIARLGARPVFADIDPATFNLDPGAVAAVFEERSRKAGRPPSALVVVHLFGQCCDMDPILSEASRRGAAVVEDAAQAVGSRYKERHAGTFGAAGTFSFFPTKNLGGLGDGGMLLTSLPEVYEKSRMLRSHGSRTRYLHEIVGGNFRLDPLQAAALRVKLKRLNAWTEMRRKNARIYRALFAEQDTHGRVILPRESEDTFHTYHQFVVRVVNRESVRKRLGEKGIGTEVYYPRPLHLQPCFADLGYRKGSLPNAERACEEVLALPIFPGLGEEEQEAVVQALVECVKEA